MRAMNVRFAILLAAISVVVIWGVNFAQCGVLDIEMEEPRCKTELVPDDVNGVKKVEVCRD